MKAYWKAALLLLMLFTSVAFALVRLRHSFQSDAPAFMKVQERSSTPMWRSPRLRRSWGRFQQMLKQADAESKAMQVGIRWLQFVDVPANVHDTLVWDAAEMINPGFAPMERWEGGVPSSPKQFVGFYSLNGQPLKYLAKHDPRRGYTPATIFLSEPIAPGQTNFILLVQNLPQTVVPQGNAGGQVTGWGLDMKFLPGVEDGIRGFGVGLPASAKIRHYSAAESAYRVHRDGSVLTLWFNSVLASNDLPHIAFVAKK